MEIINKFNIFTLILIFYCAITFGFYTPNTLNYLNSNEIKYKMYLEQLRLFGNFSIDPCDDFQKFACGRLPKYLRSPSLIKINHFDVVKKFIFNAQNKTEVEQKLINLFLTCEKHHNLTDLFQQIESLQHYSSWPVTNEPSLKDIARILGELSAFDSSIFRFIISQGTLFPIHDAKIYSEYDVKYVMNQINTIKMNYDAKAIDVAAAEIVELSKKIYSFTNNTNSNDTDFRTNETNRFMTTISSVNDLKLLIPNFEWDSYFDGLFNLLNITMNESNKYIKKIANIQLARDVVQLLNNYDKRIIMNKLIYRYVKFLSGFECTDLLPFFRPPLLKRIWNEVLTDEVKSEQLNFLTQFQETLQEITSVTEHHAIDEVMKLILTRKHILLNHSYILNDELLNEYYSNLQVDSNNFYLNYLKLSIYLLDILQPKLKEFNRNEMPNISIKLQEDFIKVFEGEYDHIINPNLKNKPRLYLFTTDNVYFWKKFFEHNPVWRNYTIAEECLSQQNEDRSFLENTLYMDTFASNRVTFLEFLEYLKENEENLKNVNKLIRQMGLNNMKEIYFISLFQNICHIDRKNYETILLRVLKHSEYFMETYQCSKGSKMNRLSGKICRIHECTSYEGKFVLRPYIFPRCLNLKNNQ